MNHSSSNIITEFYTFKDRLVFSTHVGELRLIRGFEGPFDGGHGGHLTPHLTGDAAQFEAFIGHGLRV